MVGLGGSCFACLKVPPKHLKACGIRLLKASANQLRNGRRSMLDTSSGQSFKSNFRSLSHNCNGVEKCHGLCKALVGCEAPVQSTSGILPYKPQCFNTVPARALVSIALPLSKGSLLRVYCLDHESRSLSLQACSTPLPSFAGCSANDINTKSPFPSICLRPRRNSSSVCPPFWYFLPTTHFPTKYAHQQLILIMKQLMQIRSCSCSSP